MSETVSGDISLVKMGIHSGLGNVGHRVVGRVGGDGGAESLGLGVAPDLTLVGLGDRHMGGLATAVASTVAGQELARGSGHKGGEANKSLEYEILMKQSFTSSWLSLTFMFLLLCSTDAVSLPPSHFIAPGLKFTGALAGAGSISGAAPAVHAGAGGVTYPFWDSPPFLIAYPPLPQAS